MTTDTDTLVALAADAREIASERREKAAESHMMAMAVRNAVPAGNADGWQMAADYALRTARALDAFSDLVAQLTEARAGEDELAAALREIEAHDDGTIDPHSPQELASRALASHDKRKEKR